VALSVARIRFSGMESAEPTLLVWCEALRTVEQAD
jgi:hypothetical protein